jgi:dodecin
VLDDQRHASDSQSDGTTQICRAKARGPESKRAWAASARDGFARRHTRYGRTKLMPKERSMNGHVYGLSEIVGTSAQGVDDAIRVGIQRAARTVRGLDWFEVTDIRGHLANGEIEHFQVTLKIGFRMEDPKQA